MLISFVLLLLAALHFSGGELSALWPIPTLLVFQLPFARYVTYNCPNSGRFHVDQICVINLAALHFSGGELSALWPVPPCLCSSCLLLATWLTTVLTLEGSMLIRFVLLIWLLCTLVVVSCQPSDPPPPCLCSSCLLLATWLTTVS